MNQTASDSDVEVVKRAFLKVAIESWRLIRVYERAFSKLDANEQARFVSQIRYFLKQLDDCLSEVGYKMVNLEGHPFDPGMAATAINLADFSPGDALIVEQMIEPVIMNENGLVKMGTVLLRKVEG